MCSQLQVEAYFSLRERGLGGSEQDWQQPHCHDAGSIPALKAKFATRVKIKGHHRCCLDRLLGIRRDKKRAVQRRVGLF
jgi:hypothetical protein